MTLYGMPRRSPRRHTWIRVASGVCALLAALAYVSLGPAGGAQAGAQGTTTDQITGNGDTDSTLTVAWKDGLLGSHNTVIAPRDPNSPLSFMYPDFQNLVVKVSQTSNLVHQSIQITWTGGKPTIQPFLADFLQIMQCYGDADTGPLPENCEYGSRGLLQGSSAPNPLVGTRGGTICNPGSVPSTTNPPGSDASFRAFSLGCDTQEPANSDHLGCAGSVGNPPQPPCPPGQYSVPFIPVDTTDRIYGASTDLYDRFNSNEVQEANTGADGSGQQFFQTLTATQSPGLGCGARESNGNVRDCWLVIVPRGEWDPNGYHINGSGTQTGSVTESPLGTSTWDQRIQIHLGFSPLQPNCQIGSAKERGTVGTTVVARAVFSWQLALNTQANCKTIYGYAPTSEPVNTTQLGSEEGQGLAFTTIPIGSEAKRLGTAPAPPPPLVYAPVAVSALTIGFNINQAGGLFTGPIKLTPRLLAKALTQSYRFDLPDVVANDLTHQGPAWSLKNPNLITDDPEFKRLNPDISTPPSSSPVAPLLTPDKSALNQQIWQWIQSDATARAWLAGTPDENQMAVNPFYQTLKLGNAPAIDSFPRADTTCLNTGEVGERDPGRCTLNLLPYIIDYDDAAIHVRVGNNPEGAAWDPNIQNPDNTFGNWGAGGIESAGQTFMWTITDSASLASYGLVPAELCDATGNNCVGPTTAAVTTALASATPDSTGLLHINPAAPGVGGYPLVDVTYAAVRMTQPAAAQHDFGAFITFAAGAGQTPGVDPGQLPHGYLPLSNALRQQALTVAARLLAAVDPTAPPTGSTGQTSAPPPMSGNHPPTVGQPPATVTTPAAGSSFVTSQATPSPPARATQSTPVGVARWALLAVIVVGLGGAAGGPLLRTVFGHRPPSKGS